MQPSGEAPTPGEIGHRLVNRLADALQLPPGDIDVQEPIFSYGVDSFTAATLATDLEDWLGLELPATLVWDYPTVEELSRHLAEEWHRAHSGEDGQDRRAHLDGP
jgi:acyl carrier protein